LISGAGTATLNKGVNNGGGNWTLTPVQLTGLTLTPPLNSNATINLSVTARATEAAGGSPATADNTQPLTVNVTAIADAPTLSVTSPAGGNEDSPISLTI